LIKRILVTDKRQKNRNGIKTVDFKIFSFFEAYQWFPQNIFNLYIDSPQFFILHLFSIVSVDLNSWFPCQDLLRTQEIQSQMTESTILNWVEFTITGIEILAVIIIVVAIVAATIHYLYQRLFGGAHGLYQEYRKRLAQSILVGLEVLIAADVIRTVTLDRTLQGIVVLGLLVVVRIILSWSLQVEIENRWPWQPKEKTVVMEKGEEK
jgi:uncharacterized membrane protein